MHQIPEDNHTGLDFFTNYKPVFTIACISVCIFLYAGIHLMENDLSWEAFNNWGYFSALDIFGGKYWGLISSNFLHTEIWHIAFNLYWFWILGKKVEFENSKIFYLVFIFSSALVSSLSQISFSGETGIGLSGIGYALFGFIIMKARHDDAYRNYLSKQTIILFLIWLVLCVYLSRADILNIGNAAHFGGFAWGIALAYLSAFGKIIQTSIGVLLIGLLTSFIFWSPFSTAYLSYKAYNLHKQQKGEEALVYYNRILKIDPENEFALGNSKQIRLHQLESKAYKLHDAGNYNEAKTLYKQILAIDKDNEFAKGNLKQIEELEQFQKTYPDLMPAK